MLLEVQPTIVYSFAKLPHCQTSQNIQTAFRGLIQRRETGYVTHSRKSKAEQAGEYETLGNERSFCRKLHILKGIHGPGKSKELKFVISLGRSMQDTSLRVGNMRTT